MNNYQAERKSKKCPVCFCNSLNECTHANNLISLTQYDAPFIGCYNKMVYKEAIVPEECKIDYDNFILQKLKEFIDTLAQGKFTPTTWVGYRELLMRHFYAPIAADAKYRGYLPQDLILCIKGKNAASSSSTITHHFSLAQPIASESSMIMADVVTVAAPTLPIASGSSKMLTNENVNTPPLEGHADVSYSLPIQQLANRINKNINSPLATTSSSGVRSGTSRSSSNIKQVKKEKTTTLSQPLFKKIKIKKATQQIKQKLLTSICPTSTTTNNIHNNLEQKVVVVDGDKQRRLVTLTLKDFKSLESFNVALRREMKLGCGIKFENLRFRIPNYKHSITLKEAELKTLVESVKKGEYEILEVRYGIKEKAVLLSDSFVHSHSK